MGEFETQQAKWNFDGAESLALFNLKVQFISHMQNWELEKAYWITRILRMEVDAKLSRGKNKSIQKLQEEIDTINEIEKKEVKNEKKELDEKTTQLEKDRNVYIENRTDENYKSIFFIQLEEYYMHVCYLMKKHGLFFREGEDNTLAVLKR